MTRYLTITMFDEPPVRIDVALWPIVAEATAEVNGGTLDWTYHLIVRQAADGRALISGIARPARLSASVIDRQTPQRRGGLLATNRGAEGMAHIVDAIKKVAARMGFDDDMAQRCIAALPARHL